MRIAICDDQEVFGLELLDIILEYKKEKRLDIVAEVYSAGAELLRAQTERGYDLVFLDIDLPDMKGDEIGRHIRETEKHGFSQIVYVTALKSPYVELFGNSPLDYITKPIKPEAVCSAIEKTEARMASMNNCFEFETITGFYKIAYKDIIYFKSENKEIFVVTPEETYSFYGKLSKVAREALPQDFILIHKSFLVNLLYSAHIHYDSVTLISGECLSISQSYRKNVRSVMLKRRGEHK